MHLFERRRRRLAAATVWRGLHGRTGVPGPARTLRSMVGGPAARLACASGGYSDVLAKEPVIAVGMN